MDTGTKHFFSSIIRNRHTFTLLFRDLQKKVYLNLDKALLNPQDRRNRFKRCNKRDVEINYQKGCK